MNAVEFDGLVKELEVRLDQLKALFDQYFQGMERLPPTRKRESLERALKELRRDQPRNTAARFRFQTLWQRWVTMTTHWDRICRQIEEGTYKRDVLRAQRRRQRVQEPARRAVEVDVEVDLDDFDFDAEVGAALHGLRDDKTDPEIALPPPPPPRASAPRAFAMPEAPPVRAAPTSIAPPSVPSSAPRPGVATFSRPKEASFKRPAGSMPPPQVGAAPMTATRSSVVPVAPRGGQERTSLAPPPPPVPVRAPARREELSEPDLRRIHSQYVAAGGGSMPYEKLAARIKSMEPELKKKHGGKSIDFEVVVKDGRVGLKPVTRG